MSFTFSDNLVHTSKQVKVQEETEDAPEKHHIYQTATSNPFSYLQPPPLVPDVRVDPSEKAEERKLERPEDASIDIASSPQGLPPLALLQRVRGKEVHLGQNNPCLNNHQYVIRSSMTTCSPRKAQRSS